MKNKEKKKLLLLIFDFDFFLIICMIKNCYNLNYNRYKMFYMEAFIKSMIYQRNISILFLPIVFYGYTD